MTNTTPFEVGSINEVTQTAAHISVSDTVYQVPSDWIISVYWVPDTVYQVHLPVYQVPPSVYQVPR